MTSTKILMDKEHEDLVAERDAYLKELQLAVALMLGWHAPVSSAMGMRIAAIRKTVEKFGKTVPTRKEVDSTKKDNVSRKCDHCASEQVVVSMCSERNATNPTMKCSRTFCRCDDHGGLQGARHALAAHLRNVHGRAI